MPEPSLDDVVYIVAVRSAAPKDGHEIPPILNALVEAGVEPVTAPLAAAKAIRDSGSADHAALVRLGFEWHQANTIFTVVAESIPDNEFLGTEAEKRAALKAVPDERERGS